MASNIPTGRPALLAGVALLSLGGLLLEITLTRVFSVLFFYHYVFAILSVAMLGIGLGAAIAHHRKPSGLSDARLRLQRLTLLAGAAVFALAILTLIAVPIDGRLLLAAVSAVPYLLIGMALATLFAAHAEWSPTLYWADLGGAAAGAVAAIPVLNHFRGLDALLLATAVFCISALAFRPNGKKLRWPDAGTVLLLVGVGLAFGRFELVVSRLATPKPLTQQLQADPQAQIAFTRWDAFARTDVLESEDIPWRKQIFVNGAAGSIMPRYPQDAADRSRFTGDIGYFPFDPSQGRSLSQGPERVFIIGPGGGKDLLFALLAGSRSVVAVEVSPGVVKAVRHFGDYNGDLFDRPGVTLAVGEGRSYLRRSGERYDLISLSEVIALTAERSSYILTENYVYTTEAFHDYLDHLLPGGRLAIKLYDEYTLTRAFTTAVAALKERGLDEAEATRRAVVLLDPDLVSHDAPFRSPLLILHRDPIAPEAAEVLLAEIQQAGFIPLFVPHAYERPPLSGLTTGQTTLERLVADFGRADVSPTTDDRPFFYEFRRGLPELLRQLLALLGGASLLGLLYLWRRQDTIEGSFWPMVLLFALLGAGYMLLELAVIQRLTLFLGHPTTALSTGLGAALISSGLGSRAAGRLRRIRPERTVWIAALAAAGLSLIYTYLTPILTRSLLSLPLAARIAAAGAIVFPLFFFLGMPFPLGLRLVNRTGFRSAVALAWSVNGVAAVVGSVGAVALAMLWGFKAVFAAGSILYLAVAWLVGRVAP